MRPIVMLVAIALCAACAFANSAGARGAAETKVTIAAPSGDFSGKLKSPRHKCLGGRKVIVYRIRGNGYDPEHDTKIASDTSQVVGRHGEWAVGNTGAGPGAYYALAKRSPGCKAAFSIPLQL